MAKEDPTTSATVIPSLGTPESVSSDADACRAGISRRQAMTAMTAIAAVPAAAVLPMAPTPPRDDAKRRAAWDSAFANYERGEAEYDCVSREYDAASAAYYAEAPDRDDEFAEYGLGRFGKLLGRAEKSREQLIRDTEMVVAALDYKGRHLKPQDFGTIGEKAARITDDFLAYRKHKSEAFTRFVEGIERRHDQAVDRRHKTREALLRTPAPDQSAVLVKLDLMTEIMDGDFGSEYADAIRADTRRLLAVGDLRTN